MENIETNLQENNLACPLITHQEVEVCVPITVKPFAKTGHIRTKCYGAPIIRPGSKNCQGAKDGECSFTVTQKIRVDIPIAFGAKEMIGDTYVYCLKPCTDLHDEVVDKENKECEECEEPKEEVE